MVETQRRNAIARGDNISVMTQILQYTLVGSSEVLASIGQLEFFYDQVGMPELPTISKNDPENIPCLLYTSDAADE